MKPVILVSSCLRDCLNGSNQAIRDTWGADSAIPYFFLLGKGNTAMHRDEIVLDVPDDYPSLPWKTREGKRWALGMGFDFFFQCFVDTFIDTERLAASGFEDHEYVGNLAPTRFMHGGPGYWCSRRAAKHLTGAAIEPAVFSNDQYEDQWTGRILARIPLHDDKRYSMGWSYLLDETPVLAENDRITEHLSIMQNQYHPEWMEQAWARRWGLPFKITKPRLKGCSCAKCVQRALR